MTVDVDQKPEILLFGAGSVGAIYLYLLGKVSSTTAVCRSNYDVVAKNGFTINSDIFGQGINFHPRVVRDCAEAVNSAPQCKFDYVVVCSKVVPGLAQVIAPAITPGHTAIVLVQNGVGIEQEYADAFPTNPIISGVLYLPATQRPVGVISHHEIEILELGAYPASADATHARQFSEMITASGGTAHFYEDIVSRRWSKLLINASWNPVCALTLCTDTAYMASSPGATDFVFDIMLEVVAIGQAYGASITKEDAVFQLSRAKARVGKKGVEPSMLQDVKAGRNIEVEAILGNAVRLAKERGVDVPKMEALYVLAKALDTQLGRGRM